MLDAGDAEAVADAFGLGAVIDFRGPVARGEVGQIWQLTASSGTWAVKEALGTAAVDDHNVSTAFHDAAVSAGVLAPALHRTTGGLVSAPVGATVVRVFEWADLRPPDIHMDVADVGAVLARLHRVRFDGTSPPDPWFSEAVGAARWDELIESLRTAGSRLASRFARWRDEFVALEGWLAAPHELRMCHRDLWADNLRQTTSGMPCVIDWDNAGAADPSQELAMVLFEFASGDEHRARALVTAYRDAGGAGRVRDRGDFSMAITVLAHIAEHICRQWLAPGATDAERRRAEWRFDEFDDRGLTRAVIEQLLDAVC
jgi:hypothetical protein